MDLEYLFRQISLYFADAMYSSGKKQKELVEKMQYLMEQVWYITFKMIEWEVEYAIENSDLNEILSELDELDKKFIVNRATHRVFLLTSAKFIDNIVCYLAIYTHYALQQSIELAFRDTTLKEIRDIVIGVKKSLKKSLKDRIEDIVIELLNISYLQLPKEVDKNGSS